MSESAGWTMQPHGSVGEWRRSYAPVGAATADVARRLVQETAEALPHFLGLDVRIEPAGDRPW